MKQAEFKASHTPHPHPLHAHLILMIIEHSPGTPVRCAVYLLFLILYKAQKNMHNSTLTLFSTYSLIIYYMPSTFLDAGDTALNKNDKNPSTFCSKMFLEETSNKPNEYQ